MSSGRSGCGRGALLLRRSQEAREKEEAEKKRLQEEAEKKRLQEVAEKKQLQEVASGDAESNVTSVTGSTSPVVTSGISTMVSESTVPSNSGRGRASILKKLTSMKISAEEGSTTSGAHSDVSSRKAAQSIEGRPSPVPKTGKSGVPVFVSANYVTLDMKPDMGIFHFDVKFEPMVDSFKERRLLMRQQVATIGDVRTFDGTKLFLPTMLQQDTTTLRGTLSSTGEEIKLTVIFKKKIESASVEAKSLYNILFKRILNSLKMVEINRNQYCPELAIKMPKHSIQIWPGYVLSVDHFDGGLQLQVDISHRVLRQETAYDVLKKCAKSSNIKAEAEKQLLGTSVLTKYNNRVYKIDDIEFGMSPKSSFIDSKGSSIQFVEYYKRQYDINILDINQPLLVSRPKKKSQHEENKEICLIPELCNLTGLTDTMRADFNLMRDVASHTRLAPKERLLSMKRLLNEILSSESARDILSGWGLKFRPETVELNGRILKAPTLMFGQNYKEQVGPKADWGKTATTKNVLNAVALTKWILITPEKCKANAKNFVDTYEKQCSRLGITQGKPKPVLLTNDRIETYCEAIRKNVDSTVQLVVTIVPHLRADRYGAIKKLCYVERPVASQVIVEKTISQPKKLVSVSQKIALQINCKLGGELWGVQCPFKKLMAVGMDVYHDPSRKGNSYYGFVSSVNDSFSKWYSKAYQQGPNQEVGDSLLIAFQDALSHYHSVHNEYPEQIIFFRDGVGDSQLETVREHEIGQLRRGFLSCEKGYSPQFTYVVIQKRINTRIFSKTGNQWDNPPPGCILDHHVTRRELYDFYLVSQRVGQGTVSPTHYIVLDEDSKNPMAPDDIQKLAYMLTHMYPNWCGTVRVPAPCQLAHKLANMVGEHLHRIPGESLARVLFYL